MQYNQQLMNKLVFRLNILHNLWLNQVADAKDVRQQKLLFFTKRREYLKRKQLLMYRVRRRRITKQQLAKNRLINTMRITYLY